MSALGEGDDLMSCYMNMFIVKTILWFSGVGVLVGPQSVAFPQEPSGTNKPIRTQIVFGNLEDGAWGANGRPWRRLETEAKTTLLNGIQEGIMLMIQEASYGTDATLAHSFAETSKSITISGVRFLDLVTQIDNFYQQENDTPIPVIEAYRYTVKKLKGVPKEDLEKQMARLKKIYGEKGKKEIQVKP